MDVLDDYDSSFGEQDLPEDVDDELAYLLEKYEAGEITDTDLAELFETSATEGVMDNLPITHLVTQCGFSTVTQMADALIPIIILCVSYRMIAYIMHQSEHGTRFNHGDSPSITNVLLDANVTDNLLEICDSALGLIAMNAIFGGETLMLIFFSMTAFVIIILSREHNLHVGILTSLFTVIFVILCEFVVLSPTEWHKIRGAQMIMSMKIISLAFDLETGAVPFMPNFWSFTSYVFHVGTLIFGPWISFKEHQARVTAPVNLIDWCLVRRALEKTCALITCLLLSTCFIPWIISDNNHKWLVAYRDAQSFRFSHYFVSYTSQLTILLASYSITTGDVSVTEPKTIELPRSLVEVVCNWNVPMHNWLKTYVFKNAKPLGSFPAIILTYGASSLLHGLNFQLSAVLLTLGFYTYVEYVFRDKLAIIFDACIRSRSCKPDCTHASKKTNVWVIITNLTFGALAMFHLAYLGLMFDNSNISQTGYTMWHTLSKWKNLNYLSHVVAGITYALYILI